MYDLLIIGGGASGLSCGLVIGSGLKKPFAKDKKVGIILHQKASHLNTALFNNVLGLQPGTLGSDVLKNGADQLKTMYPEVNQICNEKVRAIVKSDVEGYEIQTNKRTILSKLVVVALNYAAPLTINGLEDYVIPHKMANPEKNRIQLANSNHVVSPGLYVCGTLAGWRSQFSIAAGSGAQVATDILTLWNHGKHTKVHDKVI